MEKKTGRRKYSTFYRHWKKGYHINYIHFNFCTKWCIITPNLCYFSNTMKPCNLKKNVWCIECSVVKGFFAIDGWTYGQTLVWKQGPLIWPKPGGSKDWIILKKDPCTKRASQEWEFKSFILQQARTSSVAKRKQRSVPSHLWDRRHKLIIQTSMCHM